MLSNLLSIVSDNVPYLARSGAIILTNAVLLLTGNMETTFIEILITIQNFVAKYIFKILKVPFAIW